LKAWGAHVTTTCSSDAVEKVLELGADIALDYTEHDVMHELQRLHRYSLILYMLLLFISVSRLELDDMLQQNGCDGMGMCCKKKTVIG